MIVGIRDMFDSVSDYVHSRVSSDGALWILAMDALFLIPLAFAMFFYPLEALLTLAAVLLLTAVAVEAVHVKQTRHFGWRRH